MFEDCKTVLDVIKEEFSRQWFRNHSEESGWDVEFDGLPNPLGYPEDLDEDYTDAVFRLETFMSKTLEQQIEDLLRERDWMESTAEAIRPS